MRTGKTPTAVGRTVPRINRNHHTFIRTQEKRKAASLPPSIVGARWVPLAGGHFALVDDDDYERVMQFNWCSWECRGRRYAQSDHVPMSHFILGAKGEIDHKNGNGLDNRKTNLRPCTKHQNMRNVGKTKSPRSSRFKGVSYARNVEKWHAEITCDGKRTNLGYFSSEEEAARVYDRAALELFGEFARPNFECA